MADFDVLKKAIILAKEGNLDSARTLWDTFSEDFKHAVLTFVTELNGKLAKLVKNCPTVKMNSPEHGDFVMNKQFLSELRAYVPKIVKG
jgi:hypothetical protein